jgi:hypothetical protein
MTINMRALVKSFLQSMVLPPVLLFCGCAMFGPKYIYTQQQDSPSLGGPIGPRQGWEYGLYQIVVTRVDGLRANFMASSPGLNWLLVDTKTKLYLAPGMHNITLDISDTESQYGDTGGGATGVVGTVVSGATPVVTAEFKANHIYRFTAGAGMSKIELVLWDETEGTAKRSIVTNWMLDSDSNHSEGLAPSGKRR